MSTVVTAPMRRKAEKLVEQLATFSTGRSKRTGQRFYVVPASNRMTAHWTALDGSGCTCIGYQRRGTCTHAIAARTIHERQAQPAPAPAPKPRRTYADIFGVCDAASCDEDRAPDERYCSHHALVDAF